MNDWTHFWNVPNLSPNSPELEDLRRRVQKELRTGKYTLFLPAHIERHSAQAAAEFYAKLFGSAKENVIMVSKDDQTLDTVRRTGIHAVKEQDVLELINWERMYELGILPQDVNPLAENSLQVLEAGGDADLIAAERHIRRSIDGTKGRTFIVADIVKRARGINSKNNITADTDARDHGSYQPVFLTMVPHILGPINMETIAAFLAKTGEGRNNHPVFSEVNNMCNSPDPYLQSLGIILSSRAWYLTGEVTITADEADENVTQMGYGDETFRNLWVANEILKDPSRRRIQAQIGNPETKGEVGDVPPLSDFIMTEWCAQQLDHAVYYYLKYGVMPPDFYDQGAQDPLEHIRNWNHEHAGRFDLITVPHDLIPSLQRFGHKPNVKVRRRREVLLPPVKYWPDLGLINYDEVRKVYDYGRERPLGT
jgi:hypothetical protein